MKAMILLSGGLDSTVVLAKAIADGRSCTALSFAYKQRHQVELEAAKRIAAHYNIPHQIISIDPAIFGTSALVTNSALPKNRTATEMATEGIPNSYVPARNTLFLAYALGYAEVLEANEIHIGCNALDLTGYPDCRPEFIQAFQHLLNCATKQAVEGNPPKLVAPLMQLHKREIVQLGRELQAPIDWSHSCYDPEKNGQPCHQCDACILREEAFSSLS